jgi:hypothetical protein
MNIKILQAAGFHLSLGNGYQDYDRFPVGFGVDGQDRTERVWREKDGEPWSVAITHNADGEAPHHTVNKDGFQMAQAAVDFINAERKGET